MPLVFFAELFVLFILSRKTAQSISYLFFIITRSQKAVVYLIAFLFLPGTIIHEFSHAIAAFLLHVHVGQMELFPEYHEGGLKLGSVQVGRIDVVRNFFIGIAPFIIGTTLLFLIMYIIVTPGFIFTWYTLVPMSYLIFAISNTMFSSKKDMEGAIEFVILILVLVFVLYLLGLNYQAVALSVLNQLGSLFQLGAIFLAVPITIDLVIILLVTIFSRKK